jgi:hypothetical protein
MSDQQPTQMFAQFPPGLHVFRSQEWRSVYTNNTKIRVNASDISVTFARVLEYPIGVNALEELVEVTMTPKTLKQVLITLQETIRCHEELFGEIVLEKAFEPNISGIIQSFEMLRKAIEATTAAQPSPSAADQSEKPTVKRKK